MSWLSGYTYRKKGAVNATTAGAQTNYQKKLIVGESSGASGCDVHCENHCENFPDDVRLTKEDQVTKISYWTKELSGTAPNRKATFWFKIPSIPDTGAVDVYLYYGRSSDSGESNGDDTFELFDDFETLDESKWGIQGGSSSYSCENSCFIGTPGATTAVGIISKETFNFNDYAIRLRDAVDVNYYSGDYERTQFGVTSSTNTADDNPSPHYRGVWEEKYNDRGEIERTGTDINSVTLKPRPDLEFVTIDFRGRNSDQYFKAEGHFELTGSDTAYNPTTDKVFWMAYKSKAYLDWIFVRKYADPEPTWGSWFGEEARKISSDSGSASAALLSFVRNVFDQAAASDAFSAFLRDVSDQAAASDTAQLLLLLADSGHCTDVVSALHAEVLKYDQGAGIDDLVQLLSDLIESDSAAATESLSELIAILSNADSGIGTDALLDILASIIQSESGSAAETASKKIFVFLFLALSHEYPVALKLLQRSLLRIQLSQEHV